MARTTLKIGNCVLADRQSRDRLDWKPSPELMRLREIEKVIRARHGRFVPDPQDTDDRETCLDYVRAAAFSSCRDLEGWCSRWAPWIAEIEFRAISLQASKRRRMMKADGVAGLLMVTWAERTKIGLNTIGACDITKAERMKLAKQRKRNRDRDRQELKRRAAGRQDRKSLEGQSLTRSKPWLADGISRATWYRHRRETEVSRVDICWNGDTVVSRADAAQLDARLPDQIPTVPKQVATDDAAHGEAGRRGSGTVSPAGLQGAEPHGSYDTHIEVAA